MTDITLMSRDDLARELISVPGARINAAAQSVSEAPTSSGTPAFDKQLQRKLDVAREILLRDLAEPLKRSWTLSSSAAVREWLAIRYCRVEREIFIALFLDVEMRLICTEDVATGTLTRVKVYPREVVKSALRHNACFILFAHNHPSGEIQPSKEDVLVTFLLSNAMATVDIKVLDHVIVGAGNFYSFADKGLL